MKRIVLKTGLLFVLLDNFIKLDTGFDFRGQYILYLLFIGLVLASGKRLMIKRSVIVSFIVVMVVSSMAILTHPENLNDFLKQGILIAFNLIFCIALLNAYDFDLQKLFKDYIDLITLAAIVGVVQLVGLASGIIYLADYSFLGFNMGNFSMDYQRIQSWFEEPSVMVYAFCPVLFVSIARLFRLTQLISIGRALFLSAVFVLTMSSIGALGILLTLIIVTQAKYPLLKRPHLVVLSIILISITGFLLYSIEEIKLRVDDTIALFFSDDVSIEDIEAANLSTYALYSNFKVAKAAFRDNPVFGTGLGSYENSYEKYLREVVPPAKVREQYQLNKKDANSLFLRIAAELGLCGLILMTVFVVKNRIKYSRAIRQGGAALNLWAINNGLLVLIILRLCRQGHYTMLGFVLFILAYFYLKAEFIAVEKEYHEQSA
jgi:hypothetical protein